MGFLPNRATFLSHLRSHSQKTEDSISLSRRGFHIEPGPREKALLAEDPSLKRFKSHKKSVWRLKRIGDVLTIIVVADVLRYFVRIQRRLGRAVHYSNVAHWKAHWMVAGSLLGITETMLCDRIARCVSLGITGIPQQLRYARFEGRPLMRIITGMSKQHFVCFHKELLYKLYNGKRYFSSVANRTMYIGKRFFSSVASQVFDEISESIYAREPAKQLKAHEALVAFHYVNRLGKKPTDFNFCTALNSCAKMLNWQLGLQIHAQVIQTGNEENLFIGSALVDVYAKFGALADARRLFDGMKWQDQVLWTSIISGFSQNGRGREAILLFKEMSLTQIKPNSFTYVSVISACTSLELAFEFVMSLHAHVIELGIDVNSFVVSSLIDCYSKCGRVVQAIKLFDATAKRDIVLLNSMISGYSKNMYGKEALELFIQMQDDNVSPTNHTLTSILNACGSLTALQEGRQLHALVAKKGLSCNVFVASALIDMYSKCGGIDEARHVFDETIEKNSVLWTSMISGYAQSGRGSDALELFDYLVTEKGFIPDHVCFTAVLTACNHSGFLDRGIEYFNKMRGHYGLVPELDQYACLVDLYARNGHLREAKELMEEMPFAPNSVMWSSFLSSCKMYGDVELGREAAFKLLKMEPHSAVPYVTLAHIYAGAGLWSEMVEIRKLMKFKEIKRSTGCSSVEIGKKVHFFTASDISHPQLSEIYVEMEKLNMEMRDAKYMAQNAKELENIDDG